MRFIILVLISVFAIGCADSFEEPIVETNQEPLERVYVSSADKSERGTWVLYPEPELITSDGKFTSEVLESLFVYKSGDSVVCATRFEKVKDIRAYMFFEGSWKLLERESFGEGVFRWTINKPFKIREVVELKLLYPSNEVRTGEFICIYNPTRGPHLAH